MTNSSSRGKRTKLELAVRFSKKSVSTTLRKLAGACAWRCGSQPSTAGGGHGISYCDNTRLWMDGDHMEVV